MPVKKAAQATPNHLLRRARQARQWSQTYIAEQIGAPQAFMVNRWERGTATPSLYYRHKLCDLFAMSAEELGLQAVAQYTEARESTSFLFDDAIPSFTRTRGALLGRDGLLAQVQERLCQQDMPGLVALYGLPGVGKTALASKIVQRDEIQTAFQDGVLWSGLGPRPRITSLLSRWGELLGVSNAEALTLKNANEWARMVRVAIGLKEMLLVIDDAWTIEDALAFKVGGPRCAYLLTTRFSEIAYQFAYENALRVQELDEATGVLLLEHLAPTVVREDEVHARKLVQGVGGLPLAITIIGNYLSVQARHQQRRRVQNALHRLQMVEERMHLVQPQGGLEQHTSLPEDVPLSLRAVIGMSDEALDEESRQLLRIVSIFPAKPNTFTEDALLSISGMSVRSLDALLDAGLLESASQGRYMVHQTIADYARVQEQKPLVEERFVDYFITYVETYEKDYSILEEETVNILAALQIAYEKGFFAQLKRGANTFFRFLEVRGLYMLAETHLKRAYEIAFGEQDRTAELNTLLNLGKIAERRGEYSIAQHYFEQGLIFARQGEEKRFTCTFLLSLGLVMRRRGNYTQAMLYLEEGLGLAQQIGDKELISHVLVSLGATSGELGAFRQGTIYLEQGLALARERGDKEHISNIVMNLGAFAGEQGDHQQAEMYLQEALQLARQIGHRSRTCNVLANLGALAGETGCFELAREYLQEGLGIARQIGYPDGISILLVNLGGVEGELGNLEQAERYSQEALEVAKQIDSYWLVNRILMEFAELYLKLGQFDKAADMYTESAKMASDESQDLKALTQFGLARVAIGRGDVADALSRAEASLVLFEAMKHRKALEVRNWLEELRKKGAVE